MIFCLFFNLNFCFTHRKRSGFRNFSSRKESTQEINVIVPPWSPGPAFFNCRAPRPPSATPGLMTGEPEERGPGTPPVGDPADAHLLERSRVFCQTEGGGRHSGTSLILISQGQLKETVLYKNKYKHLRELSAPLRVMGISPQVISTFTINAKPPFANSAG